MFANFFGTGPSIRKNDTTIVHHLYKSLVYLLLITKFQKHLKNELHAILNFNF